MSKAFTRESDEVGADEMAPPRPNSSIGPQRYITREGADLLRKQLADLMEERRALLGQNGQADANSMANARRIESAVQKLQRTLDSVVVADPPVDPGKVAFGASVRIRYQHGEEETYRIVGTDEADAAQGRISSVSPLARALMHRRAGDTVRFQSPAGKQELTILNLHY